MGVGHRWKCRSCGKSENVYLLGGLSYDRICAYAKEKAKDGKYGKEMQMTVHDNPDGRMKCLRILFACGCGYWKDYDNTEYFIGVDSEAGNEEEKSVCRLKHFCSECGGEMLPIRLTE